MTETASSSSEVFFFHDYLDVLHRKRKIITQFFLTVVFVVTVGSFQMTPVYRATSTLLIDEESPNVLTTSTSGGVNLQAQDYLSFQEYYQSQIQMITSQNLARKVFNDFKLKNLPPYSSAKEPIKVFLKKVKVEPVRDSRLIKLNVENENPVLAAAIANRMAELFVKRNLYYISRNELMNLFKNEYLTLESKLAEYSKIYKEKHPAMMEVNDQIDDLLQKIERVKKSTFDYDTLEHDMQGGQYALAGLKPNNINIQDAAEVPVIPIRPQKRLNILLSIIVGLLGGVGLAFFVEYQGAAVRDIEDIERLVNWTFLGKIPIVRGSKRDMSVHAKPDDFATDAYKSIRTQLLFLNTKERPLKTIVVSSLAPQEGKTMTVSNLAIALAQSQKKVLLVDADMRRPRLHEVFKRRESKGLCHFLTGETGYEDLVQKTELENLFLIAADRSCTNSTELLSGEKFKEFINIVSKHFDFVLLDSPPIGIISDATLLLKEADGLILVIESGKTPKRAVLRNNKLIRTAHIKFVGVIINKVIINGHESYYYSKAYSSSQ